MTITLNAVNYRLVLNAQGHITAIRQITPTLWRETSAAIARKLLAGRHMPVLKPKA
jgi:hypothetical protein